MRYAVRVSIVLLSLLIPLSRPSVAAEATPAALYQQQKKSLALAVTLEILCPIAGAGAFYAGDSDKATALAVLSAVSGGAAVGAAFYLIHLSHQHPDGVERLLSDVETGASWAVLVAGGATYLLTRISGLALAPEAVEAFNADLQQRLGVPPSEPSVPIHARATGLSFIWRF